jgi:hypothetical protein
MTAVQTPIADDIAEQLSAFMDGELPEAEARFLLRRLEHDPALRTTWERMQLASQCLRGQPARLLDAGFADRVATGLAQARPGAVRRPLLRWAMAASIAALALIAGPRLLPQHATPEPTISEVPAPAAEHLVPTPGTADLVALRAPAESPAAAAGGNSVDEPADARDPALVASVEPSDRATPLPLSSSNPESPADFPLVDNGEARSWPKSELVGASSDPSIEAYLVRHNQMMSGENLGGFVPYVDVVANGQSTGAPDADSGTGAAADGASTDAAGKDGQ